RAPGLHVIICSHSLPTEKLAQTFRKFLGDNASPVAMPDGTDSQATTGAVAVTTTEVVYLDQLVAWAKVQLPGVVDGSLEAAVEKEVNTQQDQYASDSSTPLHNKPPSLREDFAETLARYVEV